MKAVIKVGGKQYIVQEGTEIYIEKIDAKPDDKVTFDQVLMIGDKIGHPYLTGATVEGVVEKHGKNKKVIIYKYTQKSRASRKLQGHRQPYTKVKITKVSA